VAQPFEPDAAIASGRQRMITQPTSSSFSSSGTRSRAPVWQAVAAAQ